MTTETQMSPRQHAERIAGMLHEAAQEARSGIERVNDPKAQVLFETVREVVDGAIKALEGDAQQCEAVWR